MARPAAIAVSAVILGSLGLGLVAAAPSAGFAAYKDARQLCSEHVAGSGMHITWSSYASKDPVDTIVRHYEKTTGRKATPAGSRGERSLAWDKDHMLEIYPASRNDAFPHCDKKPASGELSVILMSSAARP
jgi:hypothetical protein